MALVLLVFDSMQSCINASGFDIHFLSKYADQWMGKVKNILVVDDDSSFLASLIDGFSDMENLSVIAADNGKDALSILKEKSIDLLITDLKMPGLSGFELVAYVGRHYSDLPIIVMTAFGTPEMEENFRLLGVTHFIEKPLDYNDLIAKVYAILDNPQESGSNFDVSAKENLLNVLQEVAKTRYNGEVIVKCAEKTGRIFVYHGSVAWVVASTFRRTLIHCLTDHTDIDSEELQAVFQECKKSGKNFAETLIEWELVDRDALRHLLLAHIARAFADIVSWPDTDVMFVQEHREYQSNLIYDLDELLEMVDKLKTIGSVEAIINPGVEKPSLLQKNSELRTEALFESLDLLEGFVNAGVVSPSGALLSAPAKSNQNFEAAVSSINDVVLAAQRLTVAAGCGTGDTVEITSKDASILALCFNENEDLLNTLPGKAHVHVVLVLSNLGNQVLAKLKYRKYAKRFFQDFLRAGKDG